MKASLSSKDKSFSENEVGVLDERLLSSSKKSLHRRELHTISFMRREIQKSDMAASADQPAVLPENNIAIIQYWNNLGLKPLTQKAKKTLKNASLDLARLRRGSFFKNKPGFEQYNRKYTDKEIMQAIDNFKLAALNDDYEPKIKEPLLKVDFRNFLYSGFTLKKYSWFAQCLEKPKLIQGKDDIVGDKIKDESTHKYIEDWYRKTVHGEGPIRRNVRNKIGLAANKLVEYFEDNRDKFNSHLIRSLQDLKELYTEMLEKSVISDELGEDTSKFRGGHLSSETTFEERLPKYLNKQNAFGSGSFSIYDPAVKDNNPEETGIWGLEDEE